jgi:hypothetical protein
MYFRGRQGSLPDPVRSVFMQAPGAWYSISSGKSGVRDRVVVGIFGRTCVQAQPSRARTWPSCRVQAGNAGEIAFRPSLGATRGCLRLIILDQLA